MGPLQISISGIGCMAEALPKACECVEMRWEARWGRGPKGEAAGPMGEAAGLGAYPQITRLLLEGFRCRQHLHCRC